MSDYPVIDTSFLGRTRDRITWAVCNFMLNRVATRWYGGMISGIIILGMEEAASKDEEN